MNNETVSRQNLWAGNFAKSMTSEVNHALLLANREKCIFSWYTLQLHSCLENTEAQLMTRSHVDGFMAQFIRVSYVSEMERSWVRILIYYKVASKLFLRVYIRDGLYCEWRFNAWWLPHLILIKVTRKCLVISAGSIPWDKKGARSSRP